MERTVCRRLPLRSEDGTDGLPDGGAGGRGEMMELPAWADCCVAETEERATALETFIYCNEPAGEEEVEQFRSMLLAVLEEATCPKCTATAQELATLRARLVDVATSIRKAADEIGDHPAAAILNEAEQIIYAETERLPRI